LSNEVAILENLNLNGILDKDYILSAFPIRLEGLEAAFTRAVLIEP
jgi:kynurenine formamidase